MKEKRFSIYEAFRFGFVTWLDNFVFFLALTFTYLGIGSLILLLFLPFFLYPFLMQYAEIQNIMQMTGMERIAILKSIAQSIEPSMIVMGGIFFTVVYFIRRFLILGYSKITLNFYDHGWSSIRTLFSCFNLVWKDVIASLLYALIVTIGSILFVVPGIYLAITYGFYHLAIVDQNAGVLESFSKSAELTKGAKWELFGLMLLLALLQWASLVVFGLTLLVVWPVSALVYAYVYRKLQARS